MALLGSVTLRWVSGADGENRYDAYVQGRRVGVLLTGDNRTQPKLSFIYRIGSRLSNSTRQVVEAWLSDESSILRAVEAAQKRARKSARNFGGGRRKMS